MKIKNSIKKVGAVAGSAVMVGMTMGAAAALSDFPTPFVEDGEVHSQIVVGTAGHQADVVGAINVAAALGQAAVQTTEETVPGAATTDVDGLDDETEIRGELADGETLTLDNFDYSHLFEGEMEDQDGEDVSVEELVSADGTLVTTEVNETNVVTEVQEGALTYSVSYTPGFTTGDSILVLGEEYTLTAVDEEGEIRLGSSEEHRNLEVGDSVEHGPWSFNIIDISTGENDRVRVDVYEDDAFVTSQTLERGETTEESTYEFGDDNEFQIIVDDIWFGSQLNQVHIDTVYSDMTVEADEPSPFDGDWDAGLEFVEIDETHYLIELSLTNKYAALDGHDEDEDWEMEALSEGESFPGPADYFELAYTHLTDAQTTEISFGDYDVDPEDREVTFTDVNRNEHSLDLTLLAGGEDVAEGEIVGVEGTRGAVPVVVAEVDGDDVTLEYDDVEYLFEDVSAATGEIVTQRLPGFWVTVGYETEDAQSEGELNIYSGQDAEADLAVNYVNTRFGGVLDAGADAVTLHEDSDNGPGGAHTITADWDAADEDGFIELGYDGGTTVDADDEDRSNYGSIVSVDDDAEGASVAYPERQIHAHLAFGAVGEVQAGDETYTAVDLAAQGNLPDMARLDTEVTESNKDNNHLILVGGPAVNNLVDQLASEDKTRTLDEWRDNYDAGDSYLHLVEDAFVEGQHALVVAGYEADDTRNAAQYLANYGANADALADAGNELTLTSADFATEN